MSSNLPSSCCYVGVKHNGVPAGKLVQSPDKDFEYYISAASGQSTQNGILIITDVIGHKFSNAQLIADQFAANGYVVLMPDLFYGDPVPLNRSGDFDIKKWMKGNYSEKGVEHLPSVIDPIIEKSISIMRDEYGVKKIAGVGYCFGAKYVVRFLQPAKLDVGYCAHPSFVDDTELKAIKFPLAVSAAENDNIFPREKRHRSEEILKETGLPYQINLYSGVEHGFAVRGDPQSRAVRYAKESAFLQAVQWFEEHLKRASTANVPLE